MYSSTIDQIKDPIISSDGMSVITVRDLLGEDVLHGKHRAHKVLEMAEWLVPWGYTINWGVSDIIRYERDLIDKSMKSPDRTVLTRMTIPKPVEPEVVSKAAGDIFHCEQLVAYKMQTDLDFLSVVIDKLMSGTEGLPKKICLDFDIVTFNDMCPKCFSTVLCRLNEMQMKISERILLHFQRAGRTELLSNKFPITFRIIVSSYRPYKIETATKGTNLKTRECSTCKVDQSGPCNLMKTVAQPHVAFLGERKEIPLESGVFQFINPWMNKCFDDIRNKYQQISTKAQNLNTECERLSRLSLDTKDLQEEIQSFLIQRVSPTLANIKNLINSFDKSLEGANSLITKTQLIK